MLKVKLGMKANTQVEEVECERTMVERSREGGFGGEWRFAVTKDICLREWMSEVVTPAILPQYLCCSNRLRQSSESLIR